MEVYSDLNAAEEELSALSSIYGEDFTYLDASCRHVKISVTHNISLSFSLPAGYPLQEPPQFALLAPLLRGEPRQMLLRQLSDVVAVNPGQCMLFQLVEAVRDFLSSGAFAVDDIKDSAVEVLTDIPAVGNNDLTIVAQKAPAIFHGEPFTERKSTFQAHLAVVHTVAEVKLVLEELKSNRKIAEATHNVVGYRICGANGTLISDCDDDGETQAGSRILHLLNILDAKDVVVVVSRWFGGVLLGPDRFKHISNAARTILSERLLL